MAQILQPPAFLPVPGSPAISWRQWELTFENFLLAMGGEGFSAGRKTALLLHCLGVEGQRVYNSLPKPELPPGTSKFDHTLSILEKHFEPTVNVVAERYRFRQRGQHHGESIDNYVAILRQLSTNCNFADMNDEMIRDQIVEKTNLPRVRERLLMEKELTLVKAVNITRQIEDAIREAKIIGENESGFNAQDRQVNQTRSAPTPFSRKPNTHGSRPPTRLCYRCGSREHLANDKSCKAKDKKCRKCSRIGHFSNVCRSTGEQAVVPLEEVRVVVGLYFLVFN
ncbi:uncharacterized protein [Apostichopus japonicus]|uniref:uncharacterized protein n=1 Tax=Stichopus japonicus TaxID=307972 RepID=UPI003AB5F91F